VSLNHIDNIGIDANDHFQIDDKHNANRDAGADDDDASNDDF
jgi:hypothetical protein